MQRELAQKSEHKKSPSFRLRLRGLLLDRLKVVIRISTSVNLVTGQDVEDAVTYQRCNVIV